MRHNVEISGVHLADCTLLDCRHQLEEEEKKAIADEARRHVVQREEGETSQLKGYSAKQLASPYIRVDGELIAMNIAISSLRRAEAERKERLAMMARHREEIESLCKLHDGMRQAIVDRWAIDIEKMIVLEEKERIACQFKERSRQVLECRNDLAEQHLADEVRLWADLEQVLSRERDEGRAAYRKRIMATKK